MDEPEIFVVHEFSVRPADQGKVDAGLAAIVDHIRTDRPEVLTCQTFKQWVGPRAHRGYTMARGLRQPLRRDRRGCPLADKPGQSGPDGPSSPAPTAESQSLFLRQRWQTPCTQGAPRQSWRVAQAPWPQTPPLQDAPPMQLPAP